MISVSTFFNKLLDNGITFFTGVPDSLLKSFCAYVEDHADINIIAANEGNAVGLAAGHYLATGKPALVYMQNSGLGNAINPIVSLMDEDVYNIPVLLLIGWRGEPGVRDEPQHIKQGKITLSLLECLGIDYMVAGETENIDSVWEKAASVLGKNKPFAVVVKKDIFSEYKLQRVQEDVSRLEKERAIEIIVGVLRKDDLIVATTGTISRELFEIREKNGQSHANDFLAVGSMGHTSQIALGIAASRWDRTVYCFDGDGSVLMHMGSLAVNASLGLKNFRHIVFNNGAHDSVGGQPTAAVSVALSKIVVSCGYKSVLSADNEEDLLKAAEKMAAGDIQFLEVLVRKGSRKNLVRPTISPRDCKKNFMAVMHKK